MSKSRKIYVVGGDIEYTNWMCGEIVDKLEDADLVVFTGGSDVEPSFYGKKSHPTTSSYPQRDNLEQGYFRLAQKLHIPCVGICRGSQFLCVMNEGILVQHQENPSFLHNIHTYDNKNIIVSSTHHQAAYPFNLPKENYKILGWTNDISPYHYGESYDEELNPDKECEIVYYPKTKCLGIQSHPEMIVNELSETITYLQNLLSNFLENKL